MMSKVIALAGKGGVGKTTIGGLLIRYLIEKAKNGAVLAVDADPNSNLNEMLGVAVTATIGEAREQMKKDVPTGMTKDVWFEYKVNEAVIEGKGFDLLVMGRPEGPGCYCAANSLAKKSIETLKENYGYVVVDNEAGMEHISRMVTQNIDHLYVISDPSPRGILTAKRILELTQELNLNIKESYVIINRVKREEEAHLKNVASQQGIEVRGMIREDREIRAADAEGKTVFLLDGKSPAVSDAYKIFERTLGGSSPIHSSTHSPIYRF
jgi:CO dehydrogenase maturation factor